MFKQVIIAVLFAMVMMAVMTGGCKKDPPIPSDPDPGPEPVETDTFVYNPTPYTLQIPAGFPEMEIPEDNPMTEEGIALGRRLFYEPLLSGNNSISCASCHVQDRAFGDDKTTSEGINEQVIKRHAPTLINVGWVPKLFWDGRASSLEEQALAPVVHPQEMGETWSNAIKELGEHPDYPLLFRKAFDVTEFDSTHIAKAIAQFQRTFISGNSRFDKYIRREIILNEEELRGMELFNNEKADCFHCHIPKGLITDNLFHNNGLDSDFSNDQGMYEETGNSNDIGKFKTPTLRNIEFSGPYMHDGRFETLEEVIDFYSEGLKHSSTISPLMKNVNDGGIALSPQQKKDLIAFLKTMSDPDFNSKEEFSDPFN